MLAIGSVKGGPEISNKCIGRSIRHLMQIVSEERGFISIGSYSTVNVVYHVPGSILSDVGFEGLRDSSFSRKDKILMIQISVPKQIATSENELEIKTFLFNTLREANKLAEEYYKMEGIEYSSEEYTTLVKNVKKRFDEEELPEVAEMDEFKFDIPNLRSEPQRLAKEERKRLRRQAESSIRNEDVFSHVISDEANIKVAGPELIIVEAAKLSVNISYKNIDKSSFIFAPPNASKDISCVLGYGVLSKDVLLKAKEYKFFFGDIEKYVEKPMISFRAKIRLHPAINFLYMTITRILGRLCKGILIDEENACVITDWLVWSNDCSCEDMFKMIQSSEANSEFVKDILSEIPQIKI